MRRGYTPGTIGKKGIRRTDKSQWGHQEERAGVGHPASYKKSRSNLGNTGKKAAQPGNRKEK